MFQEMNVSFIQCKLPTHFSPIQNNFGSESIDEYFSLGLRNWIKKIFEVIILYVPLISV